MSQYDFIDEVLRSSLHQISTRALRDAPVYSGHVQMAKRDAREKLIKAIEERFIERETFKLNAKIVDKFNEDNIRLYYTLNSEVEKQIKELQLTIAAERAKLEQLRVMHAVELKEARIDELRNIETDTGEHTLLKARRRIRELRKDRDDTSCLSSPEGSQ